jgi:exopolyphosphatase/pppGpp-phosphohydrolase
VRAVGTNTLRQARNGAAFLERAEEALGHPIEVISGREEARLIYLGVAQTNPEVEGRRLVIDIGGGSTECILGDGFDIVDADSLYMGCVSYSARFFGDGVLDETAFERAELAAELEIQPIVRGYRKRGWQNVLGCSGTIHNIAAILKANGWNDDRDGVDLKGLRKLRRALVTAGNVATLALPGLTEDRRPVIAGGVAILCALFQDLGIDHMVTSPGALREGALYDLLGRIHHEDVRERTIRGFQAHYHVDLEHAETVVEIGAKSALFDRLFEVVVRRGHDAHVGPQGLPAPDALEGPILEEAQQLPLDLGREIADLVEEERAALGELDAPPHAPVGAREGAPLVAEEFALDERRRQRRGVHGHERAGGPR